MWIMKTENVLANFNSPFENDRIGKFTKDVEFKNKE